MDAELRNAAADAGLEAAICNPDAATEQQRFKALVFDASGIDVQRPAGGGLDVPAPDDPPRARRVGG